MWTKVVSEIGLSEAVVKAYLPKCGSYMELTITALKHRQSISTYVPNQVIAEKSVLQVFTAAGCYVVCENTNAWWFQDFSVPRTNFEVRRLCSDGSLVKLHSSKVAVDIGVVCGPFAPINNTGFVFWSSDVGWVGWSDPCSSPSPPSCKKSRMERNSEQAGTVTPLGSGLHVWSTNEVSSSQSCTACLCCGLIAILAPHNSHQDEGTSRVLLRRLTPGNLAIERIGKCTLQLPKSVTPDNVDKFSMTLFPKAYKQGVCGSHYLLMDYGPDCLISLHLVPAESSCSKKRYCILPTLEFPTELNIAGNQISSYCCSADGSVVAVSVRKEDVYRIWEPENGRVFTVPFPASPYCRLIVATGNLYSVLRGPGGRFAVVETYRGTVLLSGQFRALEMYPPMDQSWLSTFDTPEYLPIATLYQYTCSSEEAVIGSIIARRGT